MTELPPDWRFAELADVAEVTMGQSPPGTSYNEDGQGTPFFQGKAEFGPISPTVRKWTTAGTKFATPGDILMSVRAPVGPTNVADSRCAIGRGLTAIRAHEGVDQNFLHFALKWRAQDIAALGTGTTFVAISGPNLRRVTIPVPPLPEQRRIVEILDDHLSSIDAAKRTVDHIEDYLSGMHSRLRFDLISGSGGKNLPFNALFVQLSRSAGSVKQRDYLESGLFPVVDQGAAEVGGYSNDANLVIDSGSPVIAFGDHTRVVKYITYPFIPGADGLQLLTTAEGVNSRFGFHVLSSLRLDDRGYARHFSQVKKSSFVVPDEAAQVRIARFLDESNAAEDRIRDSLASASNRVSKFRRSLLHAAFTGQLTKEFRNE